MNSHLLSLSRKQAFEKFLLACGEEATPEFAISAAFHERFARKPSAVRDAIENHDLQNRWYSSLRAGKPDYTVYDGHAYLAESWACWSVYSRRYLRALAAIVFPRIGVVESVADLGGGFGFTTLALRELFPRARVGFTNLPGTIQTNIAQRLGIQHGFSYLGTYPCISELVFASEYFEHFVQPVDHLRSILDAAQPRIIVIANAFGSPAVGHFDFYDIDGIRYNGPTTSRRFNDELRKHGFAKMKTGMWNDRPQVWQRL